MEGLAALKPEAGRWSLANDIKLQETLALFSQSLSEKTKSLIEKIEDLSCDASEADVRLRNTFNEFLMLANSQFIENVREDTHTARSKKKHTHNRNAN